MTSKLGGIACYFNAANIWQDDTYMHLKELLGCIDTLNWTGFNSTLYKKDITYTTSYPSIINAKPTDMVTVYTSMKQNKTMTNNLDQKMSVQTFDRQLFAIAKELKCARPGEFKGHHLILGGFHTLHIHSWYRQSMGNSRIPWSLADSGVYAPGSVDQILTGKQHNICIRVMTIMYKALMETYIELFISWLQDESDQNIIPDTLWNQLGEAHTTFSMPDISSLTSLKKLDR